MSPVFRLFTLLTVFILYNRVTLLAQKLQARIEPYVNAKNPGGKADPETIAFEAKMKKEAEELAEARREAREGAEAVSFAVRGDSDDETRERRPRKCGAKRLIRPAVTRARGAVKLHQLPRSAAK